MTAVMSAQSRRSICNDIRDSAYSLDLARLNEVESLHLFDNGTQELHFPTAERRTSALFDLANFRYGIECITEKPTLNSRPSEIPKSCKCGKVTVRMISA